MAFVLLALVACSDPAALTFSPASLDFGEVDFGGEMPDGGYASETVTLRQEGGPAVALSLPAYDFDRLCLAGFPDDRDYPRALDTLEEGGSYVFEVGVCAYVPGELTSEIETEVVVETDGDPSYVTLPIRFTAVRTEE